MRRTADDALAGSALTHIQCLRNAVGKFGRSLPEASALVRVPSTRVLGLRGKGYLAAGMDADLILLSPGLSLIATIAGGEIIYQA